MSRSQVALESMTTYIFVFLAILLVVSVSWYFGLFDAKTYSPEKCSLEDNLLCPTYTIIEDTDSSMVYLDMDLENYNDETIHIIGVKLKKHGSNDYCESYTITAPNMDPTERFIGSLGSSSDFRFAIQDGYEGCSLSSSDLVDLIGKKDNFDIKIIYQKGNSVLPLSSTGIIITTPIGESQEVNPPPPDDPCVEVTDNSCVDKCGEGKTAWSNDGGVTCFNSNYCAAECQDSTPPPPPQCSRDNFCNRQCGFGKGHYNHDLDVCVFLTDCSTPCPTAPTCFKDTEGNCDFECNGQDAWIEGFRCYNAEGCNSEDICVSDCQPDSDLCSGRCGSSQAYSKFGDCYSSDTCSTWSECLACVDDGPNNYCCSGKGGYTIDGGTTCFTDSNCLEKNECETSCIPSPDEGCNSSCNDGSGYTLQIGGGCFDDAKCSSTCVASTCVLEADCNGRCGIKQGWSEDFGTTCYSNSDCLENECPGCEYNSTYCSGTGGYSIDGGYNCFNGTDADICSGDSCLPACVPSSSTKGQWYLLIGGSSDPVSDNCYVDSTCETLCPVQTCAPSSTFCCSEAPNYNTLTHRCYLPLDKECSGEPQVCPECSLSDQCFGGGSRDSTTLYADESCSIECPANICLECQLQIIYFNGARQYFSTYLTEPVSMLFPSMKSFLQPLIDNGQLDSVTDVNGNDILYYDGSNWIEPTPTPPKLLDAYIINLKVTSAHLVYVGILMSEPTEITFTQPLTLLGVPKLSGTVTMKELMEPLIVDGCLYSVIDDEGHTLAEDGWSPGVWNDEIGEIKEGEGYAVKINPPCPALDLKPYMDLP